MSTYDRRRSPKRQTDSHSRRIDSNPSSSFSRNRRDHSPARDSKGAFGSQGFARERSPPRNGRFGKQERDDVSPARERNGRSNGFGKRFGSSERGRDFGNRRGDNFNGGTYRGRNGADSRSEERSSFRNRSYGRREPRDNDDFDDRRTNTSRNNRARSPYMRLVDPAQVPRGKNYFEHDSRDSYEPAGAAAVAGSMSYIDRFESNSRDSSSMYDPRRDDDDYERRDRKRWDIPPAFNKFNSRKQSEGFFNRRSSNADEGPWMHDKFEELMTEEREKKDQSPPEKSRRRTRTENEALASEESEDEDRKKRVRQESTGKWND